MHARYVMPVLPFLFVFCSRVVRPPKVPFSRISGFLSWLLIVWNLISATVAYPNCLSYFNEIAGGSTNGHRHLIDSNLDWGQDLLRFRASVSATSNREPIYLAYFGHFDPRIFDLEFELPDKGMRLETSTGELTAKPQSGVYAISVNYLMGHALTAPDGHGGYRAVEQESLNWFRQHRADRVVGSTIWVYVVR